MIYKEKETYILCKMKKNFLYYIQGKRNFMIYKDKEMCIICTKKRNFMYYIQGKYFLYNIEGLLKELFIICSKKRKFLETEFKQAQNW